LIKASEVLKASITILEEYHSRIKLPWSRESVEVFVNPSKKELKQLDEKGYGVRFLADESERNIYEETNMKKRISSNKYEQTIRKHESE